MTDSNKMSRRDWFRLRPRPTEPDAPAHRSEPVMGEQSAGLQPIEQPVNHDGMDLSDLPPMREANLSEEQVGQLFSDIAAFGSDILLMQRSSRSRRAAGAATVTAEQLRTTKDSLLAGAISRVQIRYHWQAANWIDTLERQAGGIRLIRIAHKPTSN